MKPGPARLPYVTTFVCTGFLALLAARVAPRLRLVWSTVVSLTLTAPGRGPRHIPPLEI
jgi:hypothetical protein